MFMPRLSPGFMGDVFVKWVAKTIIMLTNGDPIIFYTRQLLLAVIGAARQKFIRTFLS